MKKAWLLLLALVGTSCFNYSINNEYETWQHQAEKVTIIRDDFGVPHIYGKTDADAVFGLMYAQCEDDFNRVEQNYIWATGRLGELEGKKAIYSDLRAKLFMTRDEAIKKYNSAPIWLKKLCHAFSDGINYYLATHPTVRPKVIKRFEPWMPMYFSEGSIGGDIERVSTRSIQEFYEPILGEHEAYIHNYFDPNDNEPKGSNGFAISGDLTESGNAMLLINPHTSFFFRGEVHMVSEEGLNAYGAVTWGQFFIYQGFNEKTGWMHTSTYTDVIDQYEETVTKKGSKYYYQYGNDKKRMNTKRVILSWKEDGKLQQKEMMIYRTHRGPITGKNGDKWVSTAMMWDPVNALIQSYTRTKQSNYEGFHKMMDIRTNSSNNTVYADAEGNIAYYHGNFIPVRNQQYDYTKPLDGSNPETDWQGLHDLEECITLLNPPNGWIQNCNSTPFTAAAEYSPKKEDYPTYMSRQGETFRGMHAIRLLKKAKNLNLDKLINLAYDPKLPAFEYLIPGLLEAYENSAPSNREVRKALEILKKWNYEVSIDSKAMSIAHYYAIAIQKLGNTPKGSSFTDRYIYFGTENSLLERATLFEEAISLMLRDWGSVEIEWGEINRYQRLNGDIKQAFNDDLPSIPIGMASGRWGALASFGAKKYPGTKRIYGTSGNSFVAVVEFGDKVKAKSLLAGGQSGNPESPHFDDQAERYANVQFKDVAYYRDEVEARAQITYKPGER